MTDSETRPWKKKNYESNTESITAHTVNDADSEGLNQTSAGFEICMLAVLTLIPTFKSSMYKFSASEACGV